jgi:hypothetical protein
MRLYSLLLRLYPAGFRNEYGANTAAFSVTGYVLVRPLPFYQPGRLVKLWEDMTYFGCSRNDPSPPDFRDGRRLSHSFESMAAWHSVPANFAGDAAPGRFDGAAATAALGLLLAYFAGRSTQAMLAKVSPADASVIVAGVLLCLTMALAGTAIPAWRALRVDAITAIRAECVTS